MMDAIPLRFWFVKRFFFFGKNRWRADTGAERSLSTPQPTIEMIKACYPYFAHGRSKKGEVVVYERTGRMEFGKLAAAGVTPFDMQVAPTRQLHRTPIAICGNGHTRNKQFY